MTSTGSVAAQDIARLGRVSRGRISQMYGAGQMPDPDAADSTEQRPRWRRSTAVRWLVSIGKRPDWSTASWLIPGPDGPNLEFVGDQVGLIEGQRDTSRFGAGPPLQVQVRIYFDRGTKRRLWLTTPMLPAERWKLTGSDAWTLPAPDGSPAEPAKPPLVQLAEQLTGLDSYRTPDDRYLGLIVLLPVDAAQGRSFWELEPVMLVDVTRVRSEMRVGAVRPATDPVELADLVLAMGHRLPMWPPGCATPELVAVSDPAGLPLRCEIPPVMESAWRYHQVCQSLMERSPADVAPLLGELGRVYWHSKLPDFGRDGFTPVTHDADVWAPALDVQLPDVPQPAPVDWWDAVSWALASDTVPVWLGDETARFFGDPDSVGVAVLDLSSLPGPAADVLGDVGGSARDGVRSQRVRRLMGALDQYGSVDLDRWPAPSGVDWRGRVGNVVGVHVPRLVASPEVIGDFLEVTVIPDMAGSAVGVITTISGQVTFLPCVGDADGLAMAVEHLVWHPGLAVPLAGVYVPSRSPDLHRAVGAMLSAGGRTVPWRQLVTLAGGHPERCFVTGCTRSTS